nr:MAG TPA: hypothetical protein [Caudoviricetes sp.]
MVANLYPLPRDISLTSETRTLLTVEHGWLLTLQTRHLD